MTRKTDILPAPPRRAADPLVLELARALAREAARRDHRAAAPTRPKDPKGHGTHD